MSSRFQHPALAGGVSQAPAFGLGGCLLAALLLVTIAVRLWLRVRRVPGHGPRVVVAALVGVAGLLVTLFVAGQLHYGGSTSVGPGVRESTCAPWWQEVGQPSGSQGVAGDFSSSCEHDAVDAIGPALLVGLLVGVLLTLLVFGALSLGRRRRMRARASDERFVE